MRIAICDDNIADLSNMVSIINDYKEQRCDKYKIEYTAFQTAIDFIAALESGQKYDLALLDIIMPRLSGMAAAKEIRQFNQDMKIIFSTSSPEFAVESYTVGAYYYALKPIWKDKLFLLLDKVFSEIKSKSGLLRIPIKKLEFAEVITRSIFYHLTDGSVIEAIGSMTELEKDLSSYSCFVKPHRSYIINMDHIDIVGQKEIKMKSAAVVPLAKANYPLVKEAYIAYSFQ
jgi:DNA-binding LytR/AlgR family response regulator